MPISMFFMDSEDPLYYLPAYLSPAAIPLGFIATRKAARLQRPVARAVAVAAICIAGAWLLLIGSLVLLAYLGVISLR